MGLSVIQTLSDNREGLGKMGKIPAHHMFMVPRGYKIRSDINYKKKNKKQKKKKTMKNKAK